MTHFLRKTVAVFMLLTYSFGMTASAGFPVNVAPPTATSAQTSGATESSVSPQSYMSSTSGFPGLNITSENLGLSGPISLGATYDTLLGTVFNGQYKQKITDTIAVGGLGEYGADQYRVNGTLGFELYPNGLLKVGGEYLSQVLPFSFDSGDIEQRVGQSAYGFDFQHNLNNGVLENLNVGGYWAEAPNVSLDSVTYFDENGYQYINQRNLAGATSQGLNFGGTITFTPSTSLNAALNYDDVNYDTELTSNDQYNTHGVGGTLKLNQLVGNRAKVSFEASNRKIYNTYGADIAYAPSFGDSLGLKMALFIQRLVSSNDTPTSNTLGLQFSFLGDDSHKPNYTLGNTSGNMDIVDWVADPAVYMQRVMVVAEEITTLASPGVASLSPNSGPITGGNTLIIAGTNFFPDTTVDFNDQPGTVTYISPTELSVVVPALAFGARVGDAFTQSVDVTVTNPDGQKTVFTDEYTYTLNDASITSVTPSAGPLVGGQSVTIVGSNFSEVSSVAFGSAAATSVTVNGDGTQITCLTPLNSVGNVDVSVTTPAGTVTDSDAYRYDNVPIVTSLSHTQGSTEGGNTITITGNYFTGATSVKFGTTEATRFSVDSGTTISAVAPAHAAGSVSISVTTAGGTGTGATYTYVAAPTVTSVSPSSGSTAGGTALTITGTNFVSGATVTVGGVAATGITVVTPTSISCTSPAHGAGTVNVVVETVGGSGTGTGVYAYENPPVVSSLNHTQGSTAGGNTITITGQYFTGATSVKFGTTEATRFSVDSATTISAVAPAHAAGAVSISVTTAGGTGTGATYTYVAAPTVTSVSPPSGSTAGGTALTITGTNFVSGATVTVGGVAATGITVVTPTSISCTSPAHGAGTVNVVVETVGGSGTGAALYTYVAPAVPGTLTNASNSGSNKILTGTGLTWNGAALTNYQFSSTSSAPTNGSGISGNQNPGSAGGTITLTQDTLNNGSGADSMYFFVCSVGTTTYSRTNCTNACLGDGSGTCTS